MRSLFSGEGMKGKELDGLGQECEADSYMMSHYAEGRHDLTGQGLLMGRDPFPEKGIQNMTHQCYKIG